MNASLLGLFSGFPTHHFPDAIAQALGRTCPGGKAWSLSAPGRRITPGTTRTATGCTKCSQSAAWRLSIIV